MEISTKNASLILEALRITEHQYKQRERELSLTMEKEHFMPDDELLKSYEKARSFYDNRLVEVHSLIFDLEQKQSAIKSLMED
ncbi:MAG: hypothetical protein ACRCZB_02485 [Bacteroidales bacterium]